MPRAHNDMTTQALHEEDAMPASASAICYASPSRPVLRYYGSKWTLAPWIISHLPPHRIYVEPYAGAASVLFRKAVSKVEVINDLNDELINVYKVLRDESDGRKLRRLLDMTPYARREWEGAQHPAKEPIEQARRTIIKAYFTHGTAGVGGFKASDNSSGVTNARGWQTYISALEAITNRLRGVVIEHRDALEVIEQQDSAETLFYIDPPYQAETRKVSQVYKHEMASADHTKLLNHLNKLKGMAALSGYECDYYQEILSNWQRFTMKAYSFNKGSAGSRVEVLWLNDAARKRLNASSLQPSMFSEEA